MTASSASLMSRRSSELEATFIPLLTADLPAVSRRQAIQLASFFRMPAQTRNAGFQIALLHRLRDPDESVRAAAQDGGRRRAGSRRCRGGPGANRADRLGDWKGVRRSWRRSCKRSDGTSGWPDRPEIMAAIRRLMNRERPRRPCCPSCAGRRFATPRSSRSSCIPGRGWPAPAIASDRGVAGPPGLPWWTSPTRASRSCKSSDPAVTDPSAAVRDRTLRGVSRLPALWGGKGSTSLLFAALADDAPALRRLGLTFASTKSGFWERADAQEYLKRL